MSDLASQIASTEGGETTNGSEQTQPIPCDRDIQMDIFGGKKNERVFGLSSIGKSLKLFSSSKQPSTIMPRIMLR